MRSLVKRWVPSRVIIRKPQIECHDIDTKYGLTDDMDTKLQIVAFLTELIHRGPHDSALVHEQANDYGCETRNLRVIEQYMKLLFLTRYGRYEYVSERFNKAVVTSGTPLLML